MPSNDEAKQLLAAEAHRVATVWRALDLDGDDCLSAEEIAAAPESLRALDANGDGQLTIDEIGGPFRWPGGERRSIFFLKTALQLIFKSKYEVFKRK